MQVENTLNDRVIHGLRAQFNQARVNAILTQAETMFLQTQFQNGSQSENKPETYELLESGWIDRALEFLGFGRWAIGRPKLSVVAPAKVGFARHVGRSAIAIQPQDARTVSPLHVETETQSVTDLFNSHIPKQISDFQQPRGPADNAIEYRSILVIGDQGSGKTTLARDPRAWIRATIRQSERVVRVASQGN